MSASISPSTQSRAVRPSSWAAAKAEVALNLFDIAIVYSTGSNFTFRCSVEEQKYQAYTLARIVGVF